MNLTNSDPTSVIALLEEYVQLRTAKIPEELQTITSIAEKYSNQFIINYLQNPTASNQQENKEFL
jgi:hypothetical protein